MSIADLTTISSYADLPLVFRVVLYYVTASLSVAVFMSIYKELHWILKKKATRRDVNQIVAFLLSILMNLCYSLTPMSFTGSTCLLLLTSVITYILQKTLDLQVLQKLIRLFIIKKASDYGISREKAEEVFHAEDDRSEQEH